MLRSCVKIYSENLIVLRCPNGSSNDDVPVVILGVTSKWINLDLSLFLKINSVIEN